MHMTQSILRNNEYEVSLMTQMMQHYNEHEISLMMQST